MLDDGEPKWAKLMIMSSSVRAFTTRELRDMHAHFKVAGVTSLRPVCLRICDVCDVRCAPPSTVSTQVGLLLYSRTRHKMMHCATTITPAAGAAGSPVHSSKCLLLHRQSVGPYECVGEYEYNFTTERGRARGARPRGAISIIVA